MFGCGDAANPNEKTLDLMEAYIEEAFINLLVQSNRRSTRHGSTTIRLADVLHIIRRDEKKYLRMPYIITASRDFARTTTDFNFQNKGLDDKSRKTLKLN